MAVQYVPYVVGQGLSAVLVVGLGIAVWRYRSGESRVAFVVGMAAVAVWSLADAGVLVAPTTAGKVFWYRVGYLGIAAIPTAWFVFLVQYTDHGEWLSRRRIALLAVEPALVVGLAWSGHDVFVERFERVAVTAANDLGLVGVEGATVVEAVPGPGFWLNVAYSYLLLLAGSLLLVSFIRRHRGIYRRQARSLLLGMAIPWMTNVAVLSGAVETPLGLTSIAFAAMGLVFSWTLLRYRLFEPIPLAREAIVEELDAGVLVLDDEERISEMNPAAMGLLDLETADPIGKPLSEVVPDPGPIEGVAERGGGEEVAINTPEDHRHLAVRVSPLGDGETEVGRLVVLRDVTERVLRRQRLEVLGRILRHNVRNDMNLVLGHARALRRNGDVEEHAEVIEETASDLVDVSDKARTVERMLRSEERAQDEPVDLVDRIDRLLREFRAEYPDADLRADLPERVYADGSLVVAVRELVENALEHGASTVRVSIAVEGETAEIAVEDDGPGIPEDERGVLTKGHETALEHGSGLGLWIVNWIVHSARGDLRFGSSQFGGSKVIARVPNTPPEETTDEAPAPDREGDSPSCERS